MNRTQLRTGTPLKVAGLSLTPIDQVRIQSEQTADGLWLHATADPVAVVICSAGEPYALSLDASALSLAELRRQLPELQLALVSASSSWRSS